MKSTFPFKKSVHFSMVMLCLMLSMASCFSGKMASTGKTIAAAKDTLTHERKEISDINQFALKKLAEEKIDTSIQNRIIEKLARSSKQADSVQAGVNQLEHYMTNSKLFRKNYKTEVLPLLTMLNRFISGTSVRVFRFNMIKDGLAVAEKKLFPLAAFFGPGKYEIPENKYVEASALFKPLADSIILFSNKYKDITQDGHIIVNGFADGTGFNAESPLYQVLLKGLGKPTAEKAELNMQLSELRANSIAGLLETMIKNKSNLFSSWSTFSVHLYSYGQGETYPTKTINDYQEDDERRRVVILNWCVLPAD